MKTFTQFLTEILGKSRLSSLELKARRDEVSPSNNEHQKKAASLKAIQAHYLMQKLRGEKKNPYDEVSNLQKAAQMAKAKKRLRLSEVARTRPRAVKLLNYLYTKKGYDLGSDNQMLNVVPQDERFDRYKVTHSGGKHVDYEDFDKVPVSSVPVRKIKSTQYDTDRSVITKKIQGKWKDHYPDYVNLIHHKGTYHIWDGNHRVSAARLLRRKNIKAKVLHADENQDF